MKVFIKLCGSIIRRNKGFTAGIFIMTILSSAIAFLGANFGVCSNDTIMDFIAKSGTPDIVYMTDVISSDLAGELEMLQGVRSVSPGFVYDTNIETANNDAYSVRLIRRSTSSFFRHTIHEQSPLDVSAPQAAMSIKFAQYNDIHSGERITIETPLGKKTAVINAIVSNPETMSCVKDEMSSYESYQFAYLYFDDSDFNMLVPAENMSNQWLIYLESDLSVEEKKLCMSKIRDIFSTHVLSESLTAESEALKSISDDIHTISVLCCFIPGIIWLISIGFNFIFIKIIVENQRKTIGMLKALGFSARRIVMIFVSYMIIVNLPALLLGLAGGIKLLDICLGLIAAAEGILELKFTIRPVLTLAMLLLVFMSGLISALMTAGSISGIDPCEAYGQVQGSAAEPPEFVGRLQTEVFLKISLVSFVRNYKRQLTGALCIAACIISMCIGFEGVNTIGHPIDAVYGGRYRYDLMVRSVDAASIAKISANISAARVEPVTFFSSELFEKSVRISTIDEKSELTVLTDAEGNRLFPGDGIIIDEMFAKLNHISLGDNLVLNGYSLPVTGIAREIVFMVMYVSPDTAVRLGYTEPNCALIKLGSGADIKDIEREITEICSDCYLVEFSSQKENIQDSFRAMRTVMLFFAILAFCIGSLLIINITIIDFNENRYRYATLRALGAPVSRLTLMTVSLNLIRVALGIIVACPLCYICVSVLLKLLSGASQQYVMVNYAECLLVSCIISLLYVFIGTSITLCKIRKMDFTGILNETE